MQPEPVIGREHDQRLGRKAELVERPRDREMGLVARVDARALERRAPGWPVQPGQATEMHVADEGHRDEVGHHAARGHQPEAAVAIAHEVAQPADDLLLDERTDRAGMPDVHALVRPLGEHLARDRCDQRRRREVAERARVVAVERVGRDPGAELVEDVGQRVRVVGRRTRAKAIAEELAPELRVADGLTHGAPHRLVVEPVERRAPCLPAGGLEGGAGRRGVADPDQLRLGVPAERCEGIVHRRVLSIARMVGPREGRAGGSDAFRAQPAIAAGDHFHAERICHRAFDAG